jgi:hypothetical protein
MASQRDRTSRKLEEAKFFLDQLAPNYGKAKKFDYFLSAFITSARSVLWVMRNEYNDVEGWEEWYERRQPNEEEQALLRGTNEVRVRIEKIAPLNTLSTIAFAGHITAGDQERIRTAMKKTAGKRIPVRATGTLESSAVEMELDGEWVRFEAVEVIPRRELDEFPGQNILDVCNRYFAAVSSVVRECSERFDA